MTFTNITFSSRKCKKEREKGGRIHSDPAPLSFLDIRYDPDMSSSRHLGFKPSIATRAATFAVQRNLR